MSTSLIPPAPRPPALRTLGGAPGSAAASADDDDLLTEADLAERYPAYGPRVLSAIAQLESSAVDYELICQLVQWIMAKGSVEVVQQSVGGSVGNQRGFPPPTGAADAAFGDDDGQQGPRPPPGAGPEAYGRGGAGSYGMGQQQQGSLGLDSILIFLSGQKARC